MEDLINTCVPNKPEKYTAPCSYYHMGTEYYEPVQICTCPEARNVSNILITSDNHGQKYWTWDKKGIKSVNSVIDSRYIAYFPSPPLNQCCDLKNNVLP